MLDHLLAVSHRSPCPPRARPQRSPKTAIHPVLLGTDPALATGCPVTTFEGAVLGVEQVMSCAGREDA
jgi:hypothetical protein